MWNNLVLNTLVECGHEDVMDAWALVGFLVTGCHCTVFLLCEGKVSFGSKRKGR